MLPQERPSELKAVPFEFLTPGVYLPGQEVPGNPHLTLALEKFEESMQWHSCYVNDSTHWERECRVEEVRDPDTGEIIARRYSTSLGDAMPNPYAELEIVHLQEDLAVMTLHYEVVDPYSGELLIGSGSDYAGYRHAEAYYEEECTFINKGC